MALSTTKGHVMARKDYEHWNEEADIIWWLEEGRHESEPRDDWEDFDDE